MSKPLVYLPAVTRLDLNLPNASVRALKQLRVKTLGCEEDNPYLVEMVVVLDADTGGKGYTFCTFYLKETCGLSARLRSRNPASVTLTLSDKSVVMAFPQP